MYEIRCTCVCECVCVCVCVSGYVCVYECVCVCVCVYGIDTKKLSLYRWCTCVCVCLHVPECTHHVNISHLYTVRIVCTLCTLYSVHCTLYDTHTTRHNTHTYNTIAYYRPNDLFMNYLGPPIGY